MTVSFHSRIDSAATSKRELIGVTGPASSALRAPINSHIASESKIPDANLLLSFAGSAAQCE